MLRILLTHTPHMLANYYGDRALAALRRHGEVRMNLSGRILDEPAALVAAAAGVDVIVADRQVPVAAAVFAALPDLAAVCRVAVDVSTIDVPAASRHGVLVTRATPGFVPAVVELALGFMVDLARGVSRAVVDHRAGLDPVPRPGRQLAGATLGIIGYGAIGRRLAQVAAALGMRVLVADPHAAVDDPALQQVPLPALLAASDFVACLALATAETRDMMDAGAFARMKRGAFFINLSRGELVDEAALRDALDAGHLGGAALDVGRAADQRPTAALAGRPDVIATPHIGGLTPEAAGHQAFDTVRQVEALAQGRMPGGALNPDQAARLLSAWRGAATE
jgi:D-3-phosphoglycerate dehydrogenase